MLYKTIVLELLEQNPALHQQLRSDRNSWPRSITIRCN